MMHSRFSLAYAEYILRNAGAGRLYPVNTVTSWPFVTVCPSFNGPLTLEETK